ncbi:MAG: hypothetical protein JW891_01685 [Candidatus Lokiarchaeota archaeon]|nr:hypothetical protein [Candidatus Lokiarchaeota archaeon]
MNKTKHAKIALFLTVTFFIGTILAFDMIFPVRARAQSLDESLLNIQDFSAQDYESLIDYTDQVRGVISASDMEFQELGMGFYADSEYSELVDDYSSGALNLSYVSTEFVNTTNPACRKRVSNDVVENIKLTVLLNESVNVEFNKTMLPEGYLIYRSLLTPIRIINLQVNSTEGFEEIEDINFEIDDNDFLVFNYGQHYNDIDELNFTMYIILEYDLTINPWVLEQSNSDDIIVTQQEQTIEAKYNYYFQIKGYQHNDSLGSTIISSKTLINLTISLPNKELLRDYALEISGDSKELSKYLNPDDSFNTGFISLNESSFSLDFTADFNISFLEPVDGFWTIDRLAKGRDVRQRIYFPKITSGPSDIYVGSVKIFERSISYNQNVTASSQFGREVIIQNASVEDWVENPHYISSNKLEKWGLNITLPYMILGETCPITIEYVPSQDLHVKVTDNIGMPISGLQIVVYYCGQPYGSYMSQNTSQSLSTQTTDIRSEIFIGNVPNGDFTIDVYWLGTHQGSYTVSSYKSINLVSTPIFHFPTWLIVLGVFSTALLGAGYVLYKKNKKMALN